MADRFLFHPFRVGAQGEGGVAVTTDADRHLRDKIEAVLFTAPGERVNAPSFGVGLTSATFEGLNDLTVAAFEFRIAQALRRDLGDELIVDGLSIETAPDSGELLLRLVFRRREDRTQRNLEVTL